MFQWRVGDHLLGILEEKFLPWEQVDDESPPRFPAVIKILGTNAKVFNDKKNVTFKIGNSSVFRKDQI